MTDYQNTLEGVNQMLYGLDKIAENGDKMEQEAALHAVQSLNSLTVFPGVESKLMNLEKKLIDELEDADKSDSTIAVAGCNGGGYA